MNSGLTLLAALGVLAAAAIPVFGTVRTFVTRTEAVGKPRVDPAFSRLPRIAARLGPRLSCLFALATSGALWLSRQGPENTAGVPHPAAWGALWAYALVLLVEWRLVGLPGAERRTLAGLLLAGAGVLFLGIGLTAWMSPDSAAGVACAVTASANDMGPVMTKVVAALGFALVPLAGIALGVIRMAEPPLSAAAASVAVAAWLQPALPALGWLPISIGTGAPLAVLLVAALSVLGLAACGGPRATVCNLCSRRRTGAGQVPLPPFDRDGGSC